MTGSEDAIASFLNVDLDIGGAAHDIEEFAKPIEAKVVVLRRNGRDASIELADRFASLEETLLGLIEFVRTLQPDLRCIRERLDFRRLNVGIQAAGEPHATEFAISAKAIEMIAALHFEIVFTVYAPTTA
ncbi:hypothetical protein BjapCC829_27210 [Bradyrhizobium barranii]|uniref:Uncharacterized protein n=1 Tax=Bradyrhizobium barranii TaxID=2992140 RepID=A0ABY3QCQ5_9BRAD|nr:MULTISPECIES: hypothetical protein [Bradyrhizobium]UFW83640.1 hypothetical protein BjapCC829_27210 [Bradyrhizobium japonicum]